MLAIATNNDAKERRARGGFRSIMGCNSFRRPKEEALRMQGAKMDIYSPPATRAHTTGNGEP
jgi:hypothetical protein